MAMATKLRALRHAKGMSLREVEAATGVSFSTVARAEHDKNVIGTTALMALANFYKIPLTELLEVDEPADADANAYLFVVEQDLEKLRSELNALIDKLQTHARMILAEKVGA